MDKQQLYQVPVPRATDTYSPVPHKELLEHVYERLDASGMNVIYEDFKTAREGRQLIGSIDISYENNAELGMRLAFRNSYDKSMSVAFVAGAVVWICSNGMIHGDIQFVRRHTGTVLQELRSKIQSTVVHLEEQFELSNRHARAMKHIEVDKTAAAELCGRLFIEQEIINSEQLSIMKKELSDPSHDVFSEENLWSFYNHGTHALKNSHPTKWMKDHINFHNFIEEVYQL